jgi:hypothetical protein
MRKQVWMSVLFAVLAGVPLIAGCEKKLSEDSTTHVSPDGSVSKDSTVVTQQPDGSIVKTQDTSKTPATNP